jgi:hypothetical protein
MLTSYGYRMKLLLARETLPPELAETTLGRFILSGGVEGQEYAAAEQAMEETRREWLPILEEHEQELRERMQHEPTEHDPLMLMFLSGEIKRLRRLLRLGPSRETVRERTRERVRRFRERKAAEGRKS